LAPRDDRFDAAGPELAAVLVVVIAAVGEQAVGALARPADLPRTGPSPSTSGSSWVTSLRLPPVKVAASGIPEGSVRRWCLEPLRPRSTGEGPVWAPLKSADVAAVDNRCGPAMAPAALKRSTSVACSFSQTPACCQSRSRRHAVTPDQPNSRQMPPRDLRDQHEPESR